MRLPKAFASMCLLAAAASVPPANDRSAVVDGVFTIEPPAGSD